MCALCALSPFSLRSQETGPEPRLLLAVTLKSYTECMQKVTQIVNAVVPGMGANIGQMAPAALGSPALQGVDRAQPVYITVGFVSHNVPPVVGMFVPVTDFGAFKSGLAPGSILRKTPSGDNHMEKMGDYALTVVNTGGGSASYVPFVKKWKPAKKDTMHLITAVFHMEPVRKTVLGQLAGIQAMMGMMAGMGAAGQPGAGAVDPQSVQKIMGIYFDGFKVVAEGLDKAEINIDADPGTITVQTFVHALKGSSLKKAVSPPGFTLKDIAGLIDKKAQIVFAGGLEKNNSLISKMKEIIPLSLGMQGIEGKKLKTMTESLNTSMDLITPCVFCMSMNVGAQGIDLEYIIKMDGKRAAESFEQMGRFYKDMAQFAGPDKMYEKIEYTKGVKKISGIRVDRFKMSYNTNHPQLAQLKNFPGFKDMEYDYCAFNDMMLMSQTGGMEELIKKVKAGGGTSDIHLRDKTVCRGSYNLLKLAGMGMNMVPGVPAAAKQMFQNAPSAGTEIEFDLVCSGKADMKLTVPVKLLQTAGMMFLQLNAGGQGPSAMPPAGSDVPAPGF